MDQLSNVMIWNTEYALAGSEPNHSGNSLPNCSIATTDPIWKMIANSKNNRTHSSQIGGKTFDDVSQTRGFRNRP
jgi:hypothetical protein